MVIFLIIVGRFWFFLYVGIIRESLIFGLFGFVVLFFIVEIFNKLVGIVSNKFGLFFIINWFYLIFFSLVLVKNIKNIKIFLIF